MAVRRVNLWMLGCSLTETLKNSGWVGGRNCALVRAGQVQTLRLLLVFLWVLSFSAPSIMAVPCNIHCGFSLELEFCPL